MRTKDGRKIKRKRIITLGLAGSLIAIITLSSVAYHACKPEAVNSPAAWVSAITRVLPPKSQVALPSTPEIDAAPLLPDWWCWLMAQLEESHPCVGSYYIVPDILLKLFPHDDLLKKWIPRWKVDEPEMRELDALEKSMTEIKSPGEILTLVYRKFIEQLKILICQQGLDQMNQVILLNEPPGNASPAELERYEKNTVGGIDDYGAIEAANIQQASDLHALYADMAIEAQRQSERLAMAHRIDCYFDARHSVLKGYGYYMVMSAEKYGHDPRLCPAIAECESTAAHACYGYNAWGLGGRTNYRTFSSWEEGIDAMNKFLMDNNGVCLSAPYNYCEPPYPWVDNCNKVMNSI